MKYVKVAVLGAVALMGLSAAASATATHAGKDTSSAVQTCQQRDLETLRYTGNDCADVLKMVDNVPTAIPATPTSSCSA